MGERDEPVPSQNTDRELWRKTPGDYYAPRIHVTAGGSIGIDVGGLVYVQPVEEWHALQRRCMALETRLRENFCEVCWTNSWEPIEKREDADGVNVLEECEANRLSRCSYCWHEQAWKRRCEELEQQVARWPEIMADEMAETLKECELLGIDLDAEVKQKGRAISDVIQERIRQLRKAEAERDRLRALLILVDEQLNTISYRSGEIRGDWTDPRDNCRAIFKAVTDAKMLIGQVTEADLAWARQTLAGEREAGSNPVADGQVGHAGESS